MELGEKENFSYEWHKPIEINKKIITVRDFSFGVKRTRFLTNFLHKFEK